MPKRGRIFVAPVYLFACLILGGSAQGIWQNMVLQISGVAIIAWVAMGESDGPLPLAGRQLFLIAILGIAIIASQMVPLPPAVWSHLGPRQAIADGFRTLGMRLPSEPLSLTPGEGLSSLLGIIPPLAIVSAMLRMKAYQPSSLVIALIAGTLAGIMLGGLQVTGANPQFSPWYFYEDTNFGKAVGFFANADHMATLLLIAFPFLAAVISSAKGDSMQRYSAVVAVAGGLGVVVAVGLALNGSLAGYGLMLPVIAASALIILPRDSRLRIWIVLVAILLVVGAVASLEATSIGSGKLGEHATMSVQSRADILSTTWRGIADFMPFGSGLGSFRSVYPLYERPEQVTATFVIHAHNDYAEIALELGLAGVVLMLLFLVWWSIAVWRAWQGPAARPYARAATVASAVILIHSLVDFPLRTAAIAACFGTCLALLADSRAAPPKETRALRQTRHMVI